MRQRVLAVTVRNGLVHGVFMPWHEREYETLKRGDTLRAHIACFGGVNGEEDIVDPSVDYNTSRITCIHCMVVLLKGMYA
jgi:hypothetical protein